MTSLRRPINRRENRGPLALRRRTVSLRVIAATWMEERAVTTKSSPDSAEEICKSLEQAVLKYFPRPIENVDAFLFAPEDDSAVVDPESALPPEPPTQTALFKVSSAA